MVLPLPIANSIMEMPQHTQQHKNSASEYSGFTLHTQYSHSPSSVRNCSPSNHPALF